MKLRQVCLAAALATTPSAAALAREDSGDSPADQLRARFEAAAPAVGETLPDMRLYDGSGKTHRTSSLEGHYSVIVFGCLT